MPDNANTEPPENGDVEAPESAELRAWLHAFSGEKSEVEETQSHSPSQQEDAPLETAGFEPFEFQFANGNDAKVVFAQFSERTPRYNSRAATYYAIKIYCTEDTLHRSMALQAEFRGGKDFAYCALPKVWDWLEGTLGTREFFQYDSVAEFIEALAEVLYRLPDEGEDFAEHLRRLPETFDPSGGDEAEDLELND